MFNIDGKNVYLWSGGGGGYARFAYCDGGQEGGAIVINCRNIINISKGSLIGVEGEGKHDGFCASGKIRAVWIEST